MTVENGNVLYSNTLDNFILETVDEAIDELLSNDGSINNGDIAIVTSGEVKIVPVQRFVPDICDHIAERAYDDYSEHITKFPDATVEVEKEIQKEVDDLIVRLFEKHNLNPDFYDIINTKEIKVKIIDAENCEFESLNHGFM